MNRLSLSRVISSITELFPWSVRFPLVFTLPFTMLSERISIPFVSIVPFTKLSFIVRFPAEDMLPVKPKLFPFEVLPFIVMFASGSEITISSC